MGYFDTEGKFHSIAQSIHDGVTGHHYQHGYKPADVIINENITIAGAGAGSRPAGSSGHFQSNTIPIPCHHIRNGDFVMLQGRPCQVIRISTSSATGQYRYLGVDLFTKQLHEDSSFISNPSPSVIVQSMRGPVFKQYRILDVNNGTVTAMTETGDVKPGLSVIDQSDLWARLERAFKDGRGSVRILVVQDGGRELGVDIRIIHGSRL